jgi:hypothetical protein
MAKKTVYKSAGRGIWAQDYKKEVTGVDDRILRADEQVYDTEQDLIRKGLRIIDKL